ETANSENSRALNDTLNTMLRKGGLELRALVNEGKSAEEVEAHKAELLDAIFRMLATSLGLPPKSFNFEYTDDDGNYHIDKDITPQDFFKKYVGWDLEN
ncbi:C1 family peptidase, partial [Streptococcus anginosus]